MRAFLTASALVAVLASGGTAFGQVPDYGLTVPSTTPTTAMPMAIAPTPSVGAVGIPLGAMELATPGISPSPLASSTGCTTVGGSTAQSATGLFDGGGMGGNATTGCPQPAATGAGATLPPPPALQTGRVGIPLASTLIANPGLSPMPSLVAPYDSSLAPGATTSTLGPSLPTVTAPIAPTQSPCTAASYYAQNLSAGTTTADGFGSTATFGSSARGGGSAGPGC
jgi:hypothetical protein